MAIIHLQQQVREAGRIRMGKKGAKGQPEKLTEFRLTSSEQKTLMQAASIYGGTVTPWKDNPGQFELFIKAKEIDVFAAPVPSSQWYEQWTAGGCTHRCDGQTNNITDQPCSCDPENRDCKITTRMAFFLPKLQSLGVWRLESHGYYAAVEMPGVFKMLQDLASRNIFVPAELVIGERTVKRQKQTRRFIVPELRIKQSLEQVMAMGSGQQLALPDPTTGEIPALPGGPVLGAAEIHAAHGLTPEQDIEIKARLKAIDGAPKFSAFLADLYGSGLIGFSHILKRLAVLEGSTDDDEFENDEEQDGEEVKDAEFVEEGETKEPAKNPFEDQESLLP